MNVLSRMLLATFFVALPVLGFLLPRVAAGDKPLARKNASRISWSKTVVDKVFRSEGVGVADFNKDGKIDIFVGDVWYQAPDWKMHVVRREKPWDPINYSESFCCFPEDFSGDGYPD